MSDKKPQGAKPEGDAAKAPAGKEGRAHNDFKTLSDLEKPGSRNQIRAELISIFNNALGGNLVQEIYFTEFAVQ